MRMSTHDASRNPGADASRLTNFEMRFVFFVVVFYLQIGSWTYSQESSNQFKEFVLKQGLELRKDDKPPTSIDDWNVRRAKLRENLLRAWGGFPAIDCELEPRKLGEFQRDGYRVEKLIFQTRPGIWMTTNAYAFLKSSRASCLRCLHRAWTLGRAPSRTLSF